MLVPTRSLPRRILAPPGVWGLQDSRRVQLKPFFDSKIKFAMPHRVVKSQYAGSIYQAKRPQTTFTGSNVSLSTKAK